MAGHSKIEWTEAGWHTITAAKRIGVSVDEYAARRQAGEKWCTGCKRWHDRSLFPIDRSRGDSLSSSCRGRATRPQRALLSEAERRSRRNEVYRRYYAGPAGAAIRARIHARRRQLDQIPAWWRDDQLEMGCAYCGQEACTLDHFIPVARGGRSEPGNLLPACTTCNSSKRDSDPELWLDRLRPEFVDAIATRPLSGTGAMELMGYE